MIEKAYHLERRVRQVDKCRGNFFSACCVQRSSLPKGKDSADKLGVAFYPLPIGARSSICASPSANYSPAHEKKGPWNKKISANIAGFKHTRVLIIQFQKVSFLIDLVGVDIEKGEDRRQLRWGILLMGHQRWIAREYHRRWARTNSFASRIRATDRRQVRRRGRGIGRRGLPPRGCIGGRHIARKSLTLLSRVIVLRASPG